ncbi:hypothetical protein [Phytohabitans rumicis]|uniref:Uncharacterized protein n=1 Tax=Phytohabitans rumicis TaxID=1076125 RepID=A0A6V8KRX1_9ACTN|nr:hypothetical protein [Phytohabitans rumicis]GFJ87872.1 hypothetical protein Prum_015140 [Phytohabitans rumicis]
MTALIGAPGGPHVGQCQNFFPGGRDGRDARYCLAPVLALGGDLPADRDICQTCRQRTHAFGERFIAGYVRGLIEVDVAEEWMSTTRGLIADSWAWYDRRAAARAPVAELHKIRQDIHLRERLLSAVRTAVTERAIESIGERSLMKTLEPEQWRILGRLISLCGARARLNHMLKSQDASPEAVSDLAERGLIHARLNGEEIDLTPGLIKTHRRNMYLHLSKAGESYYANDPHRVLRALGQTSHGLTLTYLLGMILFEDLAELHREGTLYALTDDDTVDLGNARQSWTGSAKLILPGDAEVWINAVIVRTTKTGQLYCER